MYMGPIVAAKAPSTPLARRIAGLPVLMLAAIVMLPWLAASALVAGVAIGLRALPAAPRALVTAIEYAGAIALGR